MASMSSSQRMPTGSRASGTKIVLERATIEAEFSEATGDTEFPVNSDTP